MPGRTAALSSETTKARHTLRRRESLMAMRLRVNPLTCGRLFILERSIGAATACDAKRNADAHTDIASLTLP